MAASGLSFRKALIGVDDIQIDPHGRADSDLRGLHRLAEFLRERIPRTPIYVHVKRTYHGLGYALRVARSGGELSITVTVARQSVSSDYIPSLTHVKYGFFPVLGRFGQIYPPNDEAFEPLILGTSEGPANNVPGDTTPRQAPT